MSSLLAPISLLSPDEKSEFTFTNKAPGLYRLTVRLPEEDWYLRAITLANEAPAKQPAPTNKPADANREGLTIKPGTQLKNVTVIVAAGAARVQGRIITTTEKDGLPARLRVHLVPAEREAADETTRYYEAPVESDGSFSLKQLAPGRYWLLARPQTEEEAEAQLPRPISWNATDRARLRRDAEAANVSLELLPCQQLTEYLFPYVPTPQAPLPNPPKGKKVK